MVGGNDADGLHGGEHGLPGVGHHRLLFAGRAVRNPGQHNLVEGLVNGRVVRLVCSVLRLPLPDRSAALLSPSAAKGEGGQARLLLAR